MTESTQHEQVKILNRHYSNSGGGTYIATYQIRYKQHDKDCSSTPLWVYLDDDGGNISTADYIWCEAFADEDSSDYIVRSWSWEDRPTALSTRDWQIAQACIPSLIEYLKLAADDELYKTLYYTWLYGCVEQEAINALDFKQHIDQLVGDMLDAADDDSIAGQATYERISCMNFEITFGGKKLVLGNHAASYQGIVDALQYVIDQQ